MSTLLCAPFWLSLFRAATTSTRSAVRSLVFLGDVKVIPALDPELDVVLTDNKGRIVEGLPSPVTTMQGIKLH